MVNFGGNYTHPLGLKGQKELGGGDFYKNAAKAVALERVTW